MGLLMSSMGKGLPSGQILNKLTDTLYKQFIEKDIKTFEDFHIALLDIYNIFNAALPGKHYDAPSLRVVEKCFKDWKDATAEKKQEMFEDFMKNNANLSKLDDYTMMTGLVTPPAAMAVKRAGENVPQLNKIKIIPDVIFVPSLTLLALVTVKLTRRISLGKQIVSSHEALSPTSSKSDGSTSTTTDNQSITITNTNRLTSITQATPPEKEAKSKGESPING